MGTFSIEALESQFKGREVVFLGNGPSRRFLRESDYIQWTTEGKAIWTCSGGWQHVPQSELGWYMDDLMGPDFRVMPKNAPYEDCLKITGHWPKPVMTSTAYPEYPGLVAYPLGRVLRHFGMHQGSPFFTESMNYAIAWGVMLGVRSFEFHGVDFINCRPDERAGAAYWMGVCKGCGIPTYHNPNSHCLRMQEINGINLHIPDLYGYLPQNVPEPFEYMPNGTIRFQIHD